MPGMKSEAALLSLEQGTRAEVRRLQQQLRRVRRDISLCAEKVKSALLITWLSGGKVDIGLSFLRQEYRAERES